MDTYVFQMQAFSINQMMTKITKAHCIAHRHISRYVENTDEQGEVPIGKKEKRCARHFFPPKQPDLVGNCHYVVVDEHS